MVFRSEGVTQRHLVDSTNQNGNVARGVCHDLHQDQNVSTQEKKDGAGEQAPAGNLSLLASMAL
jgi:hypothetical protein